jgi:hypothetical protein
MATTAEQIAALETFLASGAISIEYEGKKITRGDADDLLKRLRYFADKQAAASDGATTQSVATFTRD